MTRRLLEKAANELPNMQMRQGTMDLFITSASQTITLNEPLNFGLSGLWLVKSRIDGVTVVAGIPVEQALYLVFNNLPKVERRTNGAASGLASSGHPMMLEQVTTVSQYLTAAPQVCGGTQNCVRDIQVRVVNRDGTDAVFTSIFLELEYTYCQPETIPGILSSTNNSIAQKLAQAAVPYHR